MLKKTLLALNCFERNKTFIRFISSGVPLHAKWDLFTAVCLERKPVITREMNEIEKEFKDYLYKVEFEKSLKSDHEMRHEKEVKMIAQMKKGNDDDIHIKQTAQELVDAWTENLSQFNLASRDTGLKPDQKDDHKSLARKLDQHLILVVKENIGKDNFYLLPQELRQDGETLRQTAERILKNTCGDDLKAQIYGNAPCGFYKYKYPNTISDTENRVGAKIFIYFARYEKGVINNKNLEYQWLNKVELEKTLHPSYWKRLSQMLIH